MSVYRTPDEERQRAYAMETAQSDDGGQRWARSFARVFKALFWIGVVVVVQVGCSKACAALDASEAQSRAERAAHPDTCVRHRQESIKDVPAGCLAFFLSYDGGLQ